MKANNLFLAGVAALSLGMTACNNEDVPQVNNPGEGTTFAGMYISSMKDVQSSACYDLLLRKIQQSLLHPLQQLRMVHRTYTLYILHIIYIRFPLVKY